MISKLIAKKNIRIKIPSTYNTTPNSIEEKIYSHSITGFSAYVKQYYIAHYSYECVIQDCFICKRN